MIFIYALVILFIVAAPLCAIYFRVKKGSRSKAPLIINFCAFFGMLAIASVCLLGQSASAADAATAAASGEGLATGMGYLSAALAVGLSGIGGGIAVSASASAALGALSENDGIFGKALIFVGLAEGVALYGLLIAFMIISSL